jgi:16S rRNA (uracil1498-N3)-methyltransferase
MNLFFDSSATYSEPLITIYGSEMAHISRVLRHKPGDVIHITNGSGTVFKVEIQNVLKDRMNVSILSEKVFPKPEFSQITIAMPLLKARDRMEFAIEKAVEIGVGKIILFQSDRTEKHKVKDNRIQGIIESAMKQSLQVYLPAFDISNSIDKILQQSGNHTVIVAHEKEDQDTIQSLELSNNPILLLIGPEGGFSDKEVGLFQQKSANIVSLGSNRLRSETAGLVFLSSIHFKLNLASKKAGVSLYSNLE